MTLSHTPPHPAQTLQRGPDTIILPANCLPFPLCEFGDGALFVTDRVVRDVIAPLVRQMHAVGAVLHTATAHEVVATHVVSDVAGWLASMASVVHELLAAHQDGGGKDVGWAAGEGEGGAV